jgi:hypothetical protein
MILVIVTTVFLVSIAIFVAQSLNHIVLLICANKASREIEDIIRDLNE